LSIAIASGIILIVVGVIGGFLILPRIMSAAGGEEERETSDTPERSLLLFLGMGAAVGALLTNVAVLAAALYGSEMFSANVFDTLFLGIVLGIAGYFMGARKLGVAAVVVTVVATVIGAVLQQ
jgi:hypothetical protein